MTLSRRPATALALTLSVTMSLSLSAASHASPQAKTDVKDSPKPKETVKAKTAEEIWEGTLKLPGAVTLRLVFHVKPGPDGTNALTLDSPDQNAEGIEVDSMTRDESRLTFELKALAAKFEGKLNATGTEAVGQWTQGGGSLPLTLVKKDKVTPAPKIVGKEEVWEGKIALGGGLSLRMVFHVGKTADGTLMATADSPDQGAKNLKVDTVTRDAKKITFEMKALAGKYEGTFNKAGDATEGTWTQRGSGIPLNLKRVEKATELRRPQTPKAPFPYKEEPVTYENPAGKVKLAGTLTVPEGAGPFPAALLISGSGAQDRDESLFEHKPFLLIADALTRRGVAVLRVDDRGVGGSSGSTTDSTSDDFAGDALAGLAFLKTRAEIDPRRLGLIGHSEGGLIAPLAASRSGDVAFIVMLAGTGLPGHDILRLQARLIAQAAGTEAKTLERSLDVQARILEVARTEPDPKAAETRMKAIARETIAALTAEEKVQAGPTLSDESINAQIGLLQSPWFRFFLTHDPRPTLEKVHCPVLALNGEKDLQVPPKENLTEIEAALKKAGNTRVTARELPGLNHLFQPCKTGSPAEYATIEETMDPSVLAMIGDWVLAQPAPAAK